MSRANEVLGMISDLMESRGGKHRGKRSKKHASPPRYSDADKLTGMKLASTGAKTPAGGGNVQRRSVDRIKTGDQPDMDPGGYLGKYMRGHHKGTRTKS